MSNLFVLFLRSNVLTRCVKIDRNNAAAARLRGFEEDLGLKGNQFATILSILYVGYILMQVPRYVNCSLSCQLRSYQILQ